MNVHDWIRCRILIPFITMTLFLSTFIQVIQNNLNPKWKPFQIPVQQLCNGDYDRTIQVST